MSLVDNPNQCAVFSTNSCTKLMTDKRGWRIKWWQINKNSLYNIYMGVRIAYAYAV